MIIVLEPGTPDDRIQEVMDALEAVSLQGRVIQTERKPVIHVLNGPTWPARRLLGMRQVQGLVPTSGPRVRTEGRRFYPHHFIAWCTVCLTIGASLVFLSGYFPPGLGDPIDISQAPELLDVPWYLRPVTAFLTLFPGWAGWLLLGLIGAAALGLPWLDRAPGLRTLGRLPILAIGTVLLLAFVYLGWHGGAS